ncbi:RNA-binding protein 26-like isoform X2 [Tachypleus tridentatus]|uniref:RNA-binding protein 26-like isoform X2 n=1 Tax=Tachypleus tridentatus TaxID=6853 RepID=UPI003FCF1C8F
MLIENPDALKGWLTTHLEPLCEADPVALAKYVMALIKKDKPEKELKDNCLDQLEVFLQKETKVFVDLLFGTLNSKSYLKHQQLSGIPVLPPVTIHPITTIVSGSDNTQAQTSMPNGTPSNAKVVMTVAVQQPTPTVNAKPDVRKLKSDTTLDGENRESRRPGLKNRSRSRSPIGRSNKRDPDDRRSRRYMDDDRRRRPYPSHRYDNRYRDFKNHRPPLSIDRDRDRDREPRPNRDREFGNKDRSAVDRSRSRSRSRSWSRSRSRSRSCSPSSSGSRSRSRSRSFSRDRLRVHARKSSRDSTGRGGSPQHQVDHGDTDYRVPPHSTGPNSIITVPDPVCTAASVVPPISINQYPTQGAKRCRDFDEKGYCMQGDMCPYDHGTDPVVVEDVSLLGFGPSTSSAPHQQVPPPPGICPTVLPTIGQPPPPPGPPLPPGVSPHPPPQPDSYIPEPYNPEAPGIKRNPRMHQPFWGPPSTGMPSLRLPVSRVPPPMFHPPPPPQRTRELIGVPTIDNPIEVSKVSTESSTAFEPETPRSIVVTASQSSISTDVVSSVSVQPSVDSNIKRRPFDYTRLGPKKSFQPVQERCTLEVRKVPRHLNTITQLNGHFSKFGNIVNLQVYYGGNPEAALVQFSSHAEANAAYRCTEAVLNNRFIKVFWHNKDNNQNSNQEKTTLPSEKPNVKERLGIPGNGKPSNFSLNNKIPANSTPTEDNTERAVIFSSSGNLSRTVFNPAALKKNNTLTATQGTPLKKSKEEQKKESFVKKMEVQKKREELLSSYFQEQKILLEKWKKRKNDKEKEEVKQTLTSLNKMIESLQNDMRKDSEEIKELQQTTGIPKSKSEAKSLGLLDRSSRGRGGRGSMPRGRSFRGRGSRNLTSVDHRPRKIIVSGTEEVKKDDMHMHFVQFGEIESVEEAQNGIVVAFKTRRDAEKAIALGSNYGDQAITLAWYREPTSSIADTSGLTDTLEEEEEIIEGEEENVEDLFLGDDEDDEDSEARSWRR